MVSGTFLFVRASILTRLDQSNLLMDQPMDQLPPSLLLPQMPLPPLARDLNVHLPMNPRLLIPVE